MKKTAIIAMVILALLTAFVIPFGFHRAPMEGILGLKTTQLLQNNWYINSFYIHVYLGGIALATGWQGFLPKIRASYPLIHKISGRIYVLCFLITAITSIPAGIYAQGNWISKSGFLCVSMISVITTILGFTAILNKNIAQHRKWMAYSYACCFAAVSLRLWIPILYLIIQDRVLVYNFVAWFSWLPNLFFARLFVVKN